MSLRGNAPIPTTDVPLLPLRTGVLFPGAVLSLAVGRAKSVALLRTLHPGDIIVTFAQKHPRTVNPSQDDLYDLGTYARVKKLVRRGDDEYQLVLEGLGRAQLNAIVDDDPFMRAQVTHVEDQVDVGPDAAELAAALKKHVAEIVAKEGGALADLDAPSDDPGLLADQVAGHLSLSTEAEMSVLEERDVETRLRLVARLLGEAKTSAEVRAKIENEVRKEVGKSQREAVLREQMRAIKKELGDDDDELKALKDKLDAAGLSEEARKVADRELGRLERMNGQGPETHVIRSYLELMSELPWQKRVTPQDDIEGIATKLDQDHFGLEDVKKRVLEHMAVLKLAGNTKGSILCLVGPPGVGKTSLGQSIADATGRPLVRVSLGGVRDEAEIRGHRRTYVGALPGRVLSALRKANVKNPLVLLDEIDKLGNSYMGSPEAALLEVLDPEQNKTFTDHYLEVPFDLSEALFLCTANSLETLSPPLRDRLEIVELSGYTPDEKQHIARAHILPKRKTEHGLPEGSMVLGDAALAQVIRDYTREAGVRQLDRELSRLCRGAALAIAKSKDDAPKITYDADNLQKHLGAPKYESEVREGQNAPGVATGLAWTPFGGSILFIETSRMPGKGQVEITGQLGDVMKESARAALSYVRSNAAALGIDSTALSTQDVHIHVPSGGVPKDGPSAGVTIFTALTSLFTQRRVRSDTAMTGECTLRGRVLPVGGIKAKVLAAHRAGISRIVLPRKCARDLDEVPESVRSQLQIILVDDMSEVLAAALEDKPSLEPGPKAHVAGADTAHAPV
jgi:ATP-dependent Lon protease